MARAATSTIRASRRSCARSPRAPSTTATACRWPPAIGTNWRSTAPITSSSASISTAPARAPTAATIRFGGLMFDLLGDLRTRIRWGASNTSFVERDSARRLRGYDDRPTLVEVKNPEDRQDGARAALRLPRAGAAAAPPLRARQSRSAPRARPPARRAHVDRCAPRRCRSREILRNQLQQAGQDKGAAVVMDPGHRRPAGGRELSAAARSDGDDAQDGGQPLPGPRALRPLSAGLHVQSGHRHGGAAQGSRNWRTRPTSASGCRTAAWATSSRAPSGPSATTCRTQTPHGTRRSWSAASWSPATPTSRSWAPTTWAPSRCSTRPTCWASPRPRRIPRRS